MSSIQKVKDMYVSNYMKIVSPREHLLLVDMYQNIMGRHIVRLRAYVRTCVSMCMKILRFIPVPEQV